MAATIEKDPLPLWSAVYSNDFELCAKLSEGEEGKRRLREEATFKKVGYAGIQWLMHSCPPYNVKLSCIVVTFRLC
jgi:hypothetical protein